MERGLRSDSDAGLDWQARARSVLAVSGRTLAAAIDPDGHPDALRGELIKASPGVLCLRVCTQGDAAFLKVFDDGTPEAFRRYVRERDTLRLMRDSGLVPTFWASSDRYRWVLTEAVDAGDCAPDQHLPPVEFALRMGRWTADFETAAPRRGGSGNWLGYFEKTGLASHLRAWADLDDVLARIPLCGQVLTRNDAALHNYLSGPGGRLIGCDFESTSFRPHGWGFVTAWQALLQRFTQDADDVLESFVDGYSAAHRGGLLIEELAQVARALFLAQVARDAPVRRVA